MQWIYPFYTITPMSMENFYYIVFTMYTVFCSGIYLCNLICYFRGLKTSQLTFLQFFRFFGVKLFDISKSCFIFASNLEK